MAKRSLKSSTTGIAKAKQAFERKGWTQEYLAAEVGLSTRQSIWKFFTGRPIERHLFIEICFQLDLDWREIADLPQAQQPQSQTSGLNENLGVDGWVKIMRVQLRDQIETQCGALQSSFEMTQPLRLNQIYTSAKILPHLTNQRWLEVGDLQDSHSEFERLSFNQINQKAVPAMEIVAKQTKLMLLGKPGAGKSTFLQHIALQSNQGKYKGDCIPVFIQLRSLATEAREQEDFSFLNYLVRQGERCGLSKEQVTTLLDQGKALVLLDGLDEIPQDDSDAIFKQIDKFAQYYYQNQIIITCRSAAQQYYFRGFTYVEMADFNQRQIEAFVKRWFVATASTEEEGLKKADQFLEQLERRENQPIRELVVTPIFLSLICSVFKERATFPTKRSKLYQAGLDILLVSWDRARGIQRDRAYRNLSLPDKIKLLCQIAATNFVQGNYFFEKSELLEIIEDYLRSLPNAPTVPETLWLNSEATLKAIELQHGLLVERARDIYSFSHLTFQEYLTARKIVASPNTHALNMALQLLAIHTNDSRWREVILLTASMLPKADSLLQRMKQKVDSLVRKEPQLQQFLTAINQKLSSMQLPEKASALRAFYFTLFHNRDLNLAVSIDGNLASDLPADLALDLALARAFAVSLTLVKNFELKQILNLGFALDFERNFQLTQEFKQALYQLKAQLPEPAQGKESLQTWWQTNGQNWVDLFRSMLIDHRQIGHDWQLSQQQQKLWQQYYSANQFLVECLNSDCQVSSGVRAQIETTLLLPMQEEEAVN